MTHVQLGEMLYTAISGIYAAHLKDVAQLEYNATRLLQLEYIDAAAGIHRCCMHSCYRVDKYV